MPARSSSRAVILLRLAPALSLALQLLASPAATAAFTVQDMKIVGQRRLPARPARRDDCSGLPTIFALSSTRRIRSPRCPALLSSSSAASPDGNSPPTSSSKKAFVDPIVERARQRAGVPVAEESPKLFDDELLGDMQNVLLALERRVKEGPTSLAPHEVDELAAAVDRIVAEMKSNNNDRQQQSSRPIPTKAQTAGATTTVVATPPLPISAPPGASNPSGHLLHAEPGVISALQASDEDAAASDLDASDDEGPTYTGRGGMGQPRGTVNTYVIPGMDEMTAEEYQETLQQSIIERQRRRRASGIVGNLSSTSYLDSLKTGSGGSGNKSNKGKSTKSKKWQVGKSSGGNDDDDDDDGED